MTSDISKELEKCKNDLKIKTRESEIKTNDLFILKNAFSNYEDLYTIFILYNKCSEDLNNIDLKNKLFFKIEKFNWKNFGQYYSNQINLFRKLSLSYKNYQNLIDFMQNLQTGDIYLFSENKFSEVKEALLNILETNKRKLSPSSQSHSKRAKTGRGKKQKQKTKNKKQKTKNKKQKKERN